MIIIFNLFYLSFSFGPQVCIRNSSFRICGVVPWCSSVRNIILLHTHYTAAKIQNSSHHSQFTNEILAASPSQNYPDQPLLSVIPVYRLASSFPVYLSRGGIENLYLIFPYPVKERVTKTDIFQCVLQKYKNSSV